MLCQLLKSSLYFFLFFTHWYLKLIFVSNFGKKSQKAVIVTTRHHFVCPRILVCPILRLHFIIYPTAFTLLFWSQIFFKRQLFSFCILSSYISKFYPRKKYLPNLLVITLLPRFFVYWARYFKFWLLAYFLILLNCAKFEED